MLKCGFGVSSSFDGVQFSKIGCERMWKNPVESSKHPTNAKHQVLPVYNSYIKQIIDWGTEPNNPFLQRHPEILYFLICLSRGFYIPIKATISGITFRYDNIGVFCLCAVSTWSMYEQFILIVILPPLMLASNTFRWYDVILLFVDAKAQF